MRVVFLSRRSVLTHKVPEMARVGTCVCVVVFLEYKDTLANDGFASVEV